MANKSNPAGEEIARHAEEAAKDPAVVANVENNILMTARKMAKSKTQDWPGQPVSHRPLIEAAILRGMVEKGLVTIVTRPAKIGGDRGRTVSYITPND